MTQVPISEVLEALRLPWGARIRTELADRIEAHGIAPPDGYAIVPSEHLHHGLEYVSAIPTIMVCTGNKNPVLADEISKWCFDTQAMLADAPKQEVKP